MRNIFGGVGAVALDPLCKRSCRLSSPMASEVIKVQNHPFMASPGFKLRTV